MLLLDYEFLRKEELSFTEKRYQNLLHFASAFTCNWNMDKMMKVKFENIQTPDPFRERIKFKALKDDQLPSDLKEEDLNHIFSSNYGQIILKVMIAATLSAYNIYHPILLKLVGILLLCLNCNDCFMVIATMMTSPKYDMIKILTDPYGQHYYDILFAKLCTLSSDNVSFKEKCLNLEILNEITLESSFKFLSNYMKYGTLYSCVFAAMFCMESTLKESDHDALIDYVLDESLKVLKGESNGHFNLIPDIHKIDIVKEKEIAFKANVFISLSSATKSVFGSFLQSNRVKPSLDQQKHVEIITICPNCNANIIGDESALQSHERYDCIMRKIQCEECLEEFTFIMKEEHDINCKFNMNHTNFNQFDNNHIDLNDFNLFMDIDDNKENIDYEMDDDDDDDDDDDWSNLAVSPIKNLKKVRKSRKRIFESVQSLSTSPNNVIKQKRKKRKLMDLTKPKMYDMDLIFFLTENPKILRKNKYENLRGGDNEWVIDKSLFEQLISTQSFREIGYRAFIDKFNNVKQIFNVKSNIAKTISFEQWVIDGNINSNVIKLWTENIE